MWPLTIALAVAFKDRDVRNVKALIIGPHETPYEFGFFEVGHSIISALPAWIYANHS